MIATALLLALSLARLQEPVCKGSSTAPGLDHAIIVVKDLEAAAAAFAREGFRIKPGRLHANNLLNKHIKFKNATSIELMTVKGAPGDSMARGYAEMLAAGEGGVYLALSFDRPAAIRSAARRAGIAIRERRYGVWTFSSFQPGSSADAVFFTTGAPAVIDPPELLRHGPDIAGLVEVWLEGGARLGTMLASLGARDCGAASHNGSTGRRWGLRNGTVVIVPPPSAARPRVLGAVLGGATTSSELRPHPRFWIRRTR